MCKLSLLSHPGGHLRARGSMVEAIIISSTVDILVLKVLLLDIRACTVASLSR